MPEPDNDFETSHEKHCGWNARQWADYLVACGLCRDVTRAGRGLEIVGTSVPQRLERKEDPTQ